MTAAVATHSDPAVLLVLIGVVLGLFAASGGLLWLLGRVEDRRDMAAGRAARALADEEAGR